MINPQIHEIVDGFIERAGEIFTHREQLLDNTWPTIGLLDSITFLLRADKPLSENQQEVIRAAAGYIGRIAVRCWECFGAEVQLDIGENGIFIKATKGPHLNAGETFCVEIERTILRLLQDDHPAVPVFASLERPTSFEYPRLNLFAHGLMFGLCPYGDGPWSHLEANAFQDQIALVEMELAADCARWYERNFPREKLGQVAELYLQRLVYPPTTFQEHFPLEKAVEAFTTYAEEHQLNPEGLKKLGLNLGRSADERLSSFGLALYAAVIDEAPELEAIAIAETKRLYASVLRGPAMVLRIGLKLGADWLESPNHKEDVPKRFRIERALGFHPWIILSPKRVASIKSDAKLTEVVRDLSNLQLREARMALDMILLDTPGEIDLRLQRIYLDLFSDDRSEADKKIRALLTEPGAESEVDIYDIWSMFASIEPNVPRCVERAAKAYSLISEKDERFPAIAARYAKALCMTSNFQKCLQVLTQIREPRYQPLDTLGMLMQTHFRLNQTREWQATKDRIQELLPTYYGTMSLLISLADIPTTAN